jgi:ferredoxin
MTGKKEYAGVLAGGIQLGPYPMEKLKRVAQPTTSIRGDIPRFDERQTGFNRAYRGELGKIGAKSATPISAAALSSALMSALNYLGAPDGILPSHPPAGGPGYPAADIADDPSVLARHIKSLAYFAGADVVGICKLPSWAVYSCDSHGNPIELSHRNAVCIVSDQGWETMEAARGNDWISGSQSGRGYAMCGFIGGIVADYIRKLGYPARLHYIKSYQVVVPPLLLLSGIGELSRAGIILNPFLGLRFKASVVTTDMPLEADKPVDFGLQDFCNKCKKCADECPSRSISKSDKTLANGYEHWEFNAETCTRYRLGNPHGLMCGRCIKVCPWNKPKGWKHALVRSLIRKAPAFNNWIIGIDDLLGYGKPRPDKQWWFDPIG